MVAGLSMLLTVGSGSALGKYEARLPHERHAASFPQSISGWEFADSPSVWSIDQHGRTESISLTYHRNGHDMDVVIVDTLSPTAKLPESRLAPGDKNVWREKRIENGRACVASNCIALRHATWQRERSQQLRHVYYAYSIGNFTTSSKLALRAAHGWDRLTGGRDNPRLIGLVSDDAILCSDELAAIFQILQSAAKD